MEDILNKGLIHLIFRLSGIRFKEYLKPLDKVAEYFGEKKGFYFAWLLHYTSWLMFPSIAGLVIYIIQVSQIPTPTTTDNYLDYTNTALNSIYSICIALWTTFMVESWKRKQNYLGNRWLVRNYQEMSFDRRSFKSSLDVDHKTADIDKRTQTRTCSWLIDQYTTVFSCLVVSGIYVGIHYWLVHMMMEDYQRKIDLQKRFGASYVEPLTFK